MDRLWRRHRWGGFAVADDARIRFDLNQDCCLTKILTHCPDIGRLELRKEARKPNIYYFNDLGLR